MIQGSHKSCPYDIALDSLLMPEHQIDKTPLTLLNVNGVFCAAVRKIAQEQMIDCIRSKQGY